LVEPRVPPPDARVEVLRRAKDAGLEVGVILAPIFPPTAKRPDVIEDLSAMAQVLKDIEPDHIYGESLHIRGENLRLVEEALGERIRVTAGFDRGIARIFHRELRKSGLKGTWWYGH